MTRPWHLSNMRSVYSFCAQVRHFLQCAGIVVEALGSRLCTGAALSLSLYGFLASIQKKQLNNFASVQ